jgi:flagellin
MSYLLTNSNALTALQNLTMTQQNLSTTQSQLSTGLAIQNASDNASYWSIAQTMTSDNGALGAVGSSLKVANSMVSNFTSVVGSMMSVVNAIKNDLVEAGTSGADLTSINADIANQQSLLNTMSNGSTFNGQNWLNGTTASAQLVVGYTNGTGNITQAVTTTALQLTDGATGTAGILNTTNSSGSATNVLHMTASGVTATDTKAIAECNATITAMEGVATKLGSFTQVINASQSFVGQMQTNLTNGVGSLVDADMNQVSTRLQALQTQQQLGVQSLSIANQSSQMILKLFQ